MNQTLKAAVHIKYGPPEVLKVTDVEKPTPKANELLIKVHAATVTSGDVRLRASDFPALFWLPARLMFGLFRPKKQILGHELAGVVEAVGNTVTQFKVGDEVVGTTTMLGTGSYAEYICLPERWKHGVVFYKPKNLSFKEAAALPVGGMTALFLLEKAKIKAGMKVLIYGASGSVGSYAVQVAKNFDATVTAVCSGANIEMVKSLGADETIDYKKEDFIQKRASYDIVFDAVGKISKSQAKKVLSSTGAFVTVKMLTSEKTEHLKKLVEWAEAEKIYPFIDKEFSLENIVEAHRYVDTGRKRGNIVLNVTR